MRKRVCVSTFSERTTRMLLRGKLFPLLQEHYDVSVIGPPDWLREEFPDLKIYSIEDQQIWFDLFIATSNHVAPAHHWDILGLASTIPMGKKTMVIQHFFDAIFHHQIVVPDAYCCWGGWFIDELSSECMRQFWIYTFFQNLRGLVNLTVRDMGMPKNKFRITGSLNHDFLFDAPIKPKEQFCEELGLDPDKPIIMNTPIGIEKEQCHNDLMAVLKICQEIDAQLIFSPHPMNYNGYKNYKAILDESKAKWVVSVDPAMDGADGVLDYFDPSTRFCKKRYLPEDQYRMANFFTHVDVMTSIGNTSNLEAMIFGTPAVVNSTDWDKDQQEFKKWSFAKYYQILEDADCVDVVRDEKTYREKIIQALEKPRLRDKQRKKAVKKFFHDIDGKAYLRVFNTVRELLDG